MGRPCMAITPTTCKMMAEYHADHKPTQLRWLRIGVILNTAARYSDGELSETDMHGMFDLAFSDHDDNVREQATRLLI